MSHPVQSVWYRDTTDRDRYAIVVGGEYKMVRDQYLRVIDLLFWDGGMWREVHGVCLGWEPGCYRE